MAGPKVSLYNVIPLMGRPGSGKGTLSKSLENYSQFFHFSTGEMFIYLQEINDPFQKQIKETLAQGKFIDDNLTFNKVESFLEQMVKGSSDKFVQSILQERQFIPLDHYIIFDGLPRTHNQAIVADKRYNIPLAIYINTTEKECRHRLIHRKREDDLDDTKREGRFLSTTKNVLPIIQYNKEGKKSKNGVYGARLTTINGMVSIPQMQAEFLNKLINKKII